MSKMVPPLTQPRKTQQKENALNKKAGLKQAGCESHITNWPLYLIYSRNLSLM